MSSREVSGTKKSYDKTPSKTSRSTSGFFSKVTHLFKSIAEPNTDADAEENHDYSHLNSDQSVIYRPEHNSFYGDANTSEISNTSVTSKTANETLAEFFMKKGSEPLNDIEFEGVVSLMSKAANQSHSGSQPGNSSFFSSSPLRRSSTIEPANVDNNLKTVKTPIKLHSPSLKSRGQLSERKYVVPQTIKKRVINYSKLPSPYRTRIASPLTSYIESKENSNIIERKTFGNTSITSPSTSLILEVSANSESADDTLPPKPLSSAANVLLSSLENPKGNLKRRPSSSFSNPYSLLAKRDKKLFTAKSDIKEVGTVTTERQDIHIEEKNEAAKEEEKPKIVLDNKSLPSTKTKPEPATTMNISEVIDLESENEDSEDKMEVTKEEKPEPVEEKKPSALPKFDFTSATKTSPSFNFTKTDTTEEKSIPSIKEGVKAGNNFSTATPSFLTNTTEEGKPVQLKSATFEVPSINKVFNEVISPSVAKTSETISGSNTAELDYKFAQVSSSNIDLLKFVDDDIAMTYDKEFVFM